VCVGVRVCVCGVCVSELVSARAGKGMGERDGKKTTLMKRTSDEGKEEDEGEEEVVITD